MDRRPSSLRNSLTEELTGKKETTLSTPRDLLMTNIFELVLNK
jgi:hypothetical protein